MAMPNCTHLLQSPSIKEFIVFSRPASKPEQIEIDNISAGKFNQRKTNKLWGGKKKTLKGANHVR